MGGRAPSRRRQAAEDLVATGAAEEFDEDELLSELPEPLWDVLDESDEPDVDPAALDVDPDEPLLPRESVR